MSGLKKSPTALIERHGDRRSRKTAEELRELHHHLGERVKELRCLYGIAQLVDHCGNDITRFLQGVAELIPPSWQYPEATCARITFNSEHYGTEGFTKTRWKQSADIMVDGRKAGVVEVCYLKKMLNSDEGPFLNEERALIDAIAKRIGRVAERILATEETHKLHHHLNERVKELQCLYGIAQLVDHCGDDVDTLLQSIADIIPRSWQYPEDTCARIIFNEKWFVSEGFEMTCWKQSADITVDGRKAGMVEVCYRTKMPDSDEGPFLKEERALINAIAERIGRVIERLRAVEKSHYAHGELKVERARLLESNTALKVVLARIEEEKMEIKTTILANVDRILMPILHTLEQEVPAGQKAYMGLLRRNLEEIASPLVDALSKSYLGLTPVEIQICNMITSGLTTKQIARTRHVSPSTVRGQREYIRRKFGIVNKDINLVTYLQAFERGLVNPPAALPTN